MKLRELDAKFLKRVDSHNFSYVDNMNDADGVWFLCPKCFTYNNGKIGTHGVICWRPHIPQDTSPTPGRWNFGGNNLDDLTFVGPNAVSIQLTGGCNAHFFVRNGSIEGLT